MARKRSNLDNASLQETGVPYEIVYPAPIRKRKRGKVGSAANIKVQENRLDRRLDQEFSVRLSREAVRTRTFELGEWSDLKSYKSITISDEKVYLNDIVYVAAGSQSQIPAIARSVDSQHDDSAYDGCWVAQILDIRAYSENSIFARVFWIYRADDLPKGRQPHHAAGEVFPSNHMDIIDATTINGLCSSLNKVVEDDFQKLSGGYEALFWRQAIKFHSQRTVVLNTLRRICTCNLPANLDFGPVECNGKNGCHKWMHAECVEEEIRKRVQEQYEVVDHIEAEDAGTPQRKLTANEPRDEILPPFLKRRATDGKGRPTETKDGTDMNIEVNLQRPAEEGVFLQATVNIHAGSTHLLEESAVCLFCNIPLMAQIGHRMLDPGLEVTDRKDR